MTVTRDEIGRLHRSFAGVESDYVRELGRRAHGSGVGGRARPGHTPASRDRDHSTPPSSRSVLVSMPRRRRQR
jgi:hypothetical protein